MSFSVTTIEYFLAHASWITFLIWNRHAIYKAACGGNGIPQPDEIGKLFAPFALLVHYIEYQWGGKEFSLEVAGIWMALMGVLNYTKNRNVHTDFPTHT